MIVAAKLRRKSKGHEHHQPDGEDQLVLHGAHRGADALRAVGQHGEFRRGGEAGGELRQEGLHAVDDLDHVGAGLALDVDQHRGQIVGPSGEPPILGGILDPRHVAQPQRRAVAPGDDQVAVLLDRAELVVRIHQDRPHRSVEAALGLN
jgi:hypothetical protein